MPEFTLDTTEKILSAIAAAIAIVGAIGWLLRRGALDQANNVPSSNAHNAATQSVTVNVGNPAPASGSAPTLVQPETDVAELKRTTHILFIDDDRGFKIVTILKKMGWDNTKLVTDITSLEQPALLGADVVFVDIQGVGRAMQYSDEGLGLASALKRRHPRKKVVIYSAEEKGARFHEALRLADYSLPKTAEPIQFEDTILKVLAK